MNNLLMYLGGLVVLVLGALFAVPLFIDWNSYRGAFEEEASRLLGRDVRVGGQVHLRLLPTPTLRLEKVRIADTSGQTGEPFFRTETFTLYLAVAPLLRGTVEATDIELTRPVLHLAIDENGHGNWRAFKRNEGRGGFSPSGIALPSIKLVDGVVALHGLKGEQRLRIEKVYGEIGTPSIEGPYRVRLGFLQDKDEKELRLSTARPEADGTVRFKASLRVMASGASYVVDGRLKDFLGAAAIEGELGAKLPLATAPGPGGAKGPDEDALDLKSTLTANAAGFSLGDVALSFERGGRPQIVTGSVSGQWRQSLSVEATFGSRWLDLDQIGGRQKLAIGDLAQTITDRLGWILPKAARASVRLAVDQATVGGDILSQIMLALDRSADTITIRELRATMPGGSRVDVRGVVQLGGGRPTRFDGEAMIRGSSLTRFLSWSLGAAAPELRRDSAFDVRGKLSIESSAVLVNDLKAELAGNAMSGSVTYRHDGRRQIALALEGSEIDTAALPVGTLGLDGLLSQLAPRLATSKSGKPAAPPPSAGLTAIDVVARLNVGRLTLAERQFRDVVADVSREAGRLRIGTLRFATEEGLAVEMQGEVGGLDKRAKGTLTGLLTLDGVRSVDVLTGAIGLPEALRPSAQRAEAMTPSRLAFALSIGERAEAAWDLRLDGLVGGSRVIVTSRLDAASAALADLPVDLDIRLESGETETMLRQVLPYGAGGLAGRFGTGPGRASLRAIGRLGGSLAGLASLRVAGLDLNYAGAMGMAPAGLALDGRADVAGEVRRLLIVTGLGSRPGLERLMASGRARVVARDGTVRIEAAQLLIDKTRVFGDVVVTAKAAEREVVGRFRASRAGVLPLLALMLDGRAESAASGASLWPEAPFDFGALEGVKGRVRIEADRLEIVGGLGIDGAAVDLTLAPGKVDIVVGAGRALDGAVRAVAGIKRIPGGASLTGEVALANAGLERLVAMTDAASPATGRASASMSFSGQALTPRGLVGSLKGRGSIEIGAAQLLRLAPEAVTAATLAAFESKEPLSGPALAAVIGDGLGKGNLALGPRRVSFDVTDGAIRLQPFHLDSPKGRLVTQSFVDLDGLRVDSEWRIEAKAPPSPDKSTRPDLPPVTVVFSGPLANLGASDRVVRSEELEREITVRRIEREVEEFERRRRAAEERAGADAGSSGFAPTVTPAAPAGQPAPTLGPAAAPTPGPTSAPAPSVPPASPGAGAASNAAPPVPVGAPGGAVALPGPSSVAAPPTDTAPKADAAPLPALAPLPGPDVRKTAPAAAEPKRPLKRMGDPFRIEGGQ